MHQETTTINAEELFGNFSDLSGFQNVEDGFEKYWEWPDEIGNGFMYVIKFRPGLMLGVGGLPALGKHNSYFRDSKLTGCYGIQCFNKLSGYS